MNFQLPRSISPLAEVPQRDRGAGWQSAGTLASVREAHCWVYSPGNGCAGFFLFSRVSSLTTFLLDNFSPPFSTLFTF